MGNFTNAWIIAVCMAIFGQTGTSKQLTFDGSQKTLVLMYGIGAVVCVFMVVYRLIYLKESEVRHFGET